MSECHFWADVILRQSRLRASRDSPAQKLQGLRVVYRKNFSTATFFCFLGNSFGQQIFELFALETNLEKKCSVRYALRSQGQLNQHCNLDTDFSDIMNVSLHSGYPVMHSLVLEGLPAKMDKLTRVLLKIYAVCSLLALFFSILGDIRFHQKGLGK